MRTLISALVLGLSAAPLAAQAVSFSELPTTIQSCVSAGSCVVDFSGSYDSGTASAFLMFDYSSSQWNWLVRYDLVSPSGQTETDGAGSTTGSSSFGEHLWMQVQSSYNTVETAHEVTLFMDKVSPAPDALVGQNQSNFYPDYYDANGDLTLFMTTTDLLAGSAYISAADPVPDLYQEAGDLSGELPVLCLAEGCSIHAQLNLVQLNYQDNGSGQIQMAAFNSSDTRGLIYTQSEAYFPGYGAEYGGGTTQAFHITAVPEPEAYWLFGVGLIGVAAAARRHSTSRAQ